MDVEDTSIFEETLKERQTKLRLWSLETSKVYLPLNDAIMQLIEMLDEERKQYGKVKAAVTLAMFKKFDVFSSAILNHIELESTTVSAFAFAALNYRLFSIDEKEGIETVDGIEIVGKIGNRYKLAGFLITDVQYDDLIYWARHGKTNASEKELLSSDSIETMASATNYNIGTDLKVIRDLVYNPKKRWRDYAETEFEFYQLLRDFVVNFKQYATRETRIAKAGVPHEMNIKANVEEILDMVIDQSLKLMKNLEKYRICYNDKEWIDGDDIDEIPFEEYIRLSNGACWAVENLIEHFQRVKGFNRPPGNQGYPTKTLFNKWEPKVDRERLFDHPIAVAQNLREWYEERNRNLRDYAKIISDETMQTMKELLEVLASRGPAFVQALRKELPPEALDALRKAQGIISETGQYKDQITTIVNELLKSQASFGLVEYMKKLPLKEYEALNEFEPDLMSILTSCSQGRACVWYTADIVRNAYNDIAQVKGIPEIFTGKSKFDHVTPIKIEF